MGGPLAQPTPSRHINTPNAIVDFSKPNSCTVDGPKVTEMPPYDVYITIHRAYNPEYDVMKGIPTTASPQVIHDKAYR